MEGAEGSHSLRAKMKVCDSFPWPICPYDTLRVAPDFKSDDDKLRVLVLDEGQFSTNESGLGSGGMVRWRKCGTLNTDTSMLLKGVDVVSVKAVTSGDGFVIPLVLDYVEKPSSGLVQSTLWS